MRCDTSRVALWLNSAYAPTSTVIGGIGTPKRVRLRKVNVLPDDVVKAAAKIQTD